MDGPDAMTVWKNGARMSLDVYACLAGVPPSPAGSFPPLPSILSPPLSQESFGSKPASRPSPSWPAWASPGPNTGLPKASSQPRMNRYRSGPIQDCEWHITCLIAMNTSSLHQLIVPIVGEGWRQYVAQPSGPSPRCTHQALARSDSCPVGPISAAMRCAPSHLTFLRKFLPHGLVACAPNYPELVRNTRHSPVARNRPPMFMVDNFVAHRGSKAPLQTSRPRRKERTIAHRRARCNTRRPQKHRTDTRKNGFAVAGELANDATQESGTTPSDKSCMERHQKLYPKRLQRLVQERNWTSPVQLRPSLANSWPMSARARTIFDKIWTMFGQHWQNLAKFGLTLAKVAPSLAQNRPVLGELLVHVWSTTAKFARQFAELCQSWPKSAQCFPATGKVEPSRWSKSTNLGQHQPNFGRIRPEFGERMVEIATSLVELGPYRARRRG